MLIKITYSPISFIFYSAMNSNKYIHIIKNTFNKLSHIKIKLFHIQNSELNVFMTILNLISIALSFLILDFHLNLK